MGLDAELVVGFGVLNIGLEAWKGEVNVGNAAEIGVMLLWGYLFAQIFTQEKATISTLSTRMLIIPLCVFLCANVLKSTLNSGVSSSISFLFIFIFQLILTVDKAEALAQAKEISPFPGIHREVTADLKPLKELIEYLGTLSDGKVDMEDFLPALKSLYPRIPAYVHTAMRQIGKYASYNDILQAANSAYLVQKQYRAPAHIITT